MREEGGSGDSYQVEFSYQPAVDAAESAGMSFDRYDALRDDLEGFFGERLPDWLGTAFDSAVEQYFEDLDAEPGVADVDHEYTDRHGGTVAVETDDGLEEGGEELLYSAMEYAVEKVLDHSDPLEDHELTYSVDVDEDGASISFGLEQ